MLGRAAGWVVCPVALPFLQKRELDALVGPHLPILESLPYIEVDTCRLVRVRHRRPPQISLVRGWRGNPAIGCAAARFTCAEGPAELINANIACPSTIGV